MSLRKAINDKCRECIVDPLDAGGASHQIACCISSDCPLHRVRPITCTQIPMRLLNHWEITPEQLDGRARALVVLDDTTPVRAQAEHPQSTESIVGGERMSNLPSQDVVGHVNALQQQIDRLTKARRAT